MDSTEKFYQREVDRTPYSAFVWVGLFLIAIFSTGAFGIWKVGTFISNHHFLASHEVQGATDAYLENANAAAAGAASSASKSAADAAQAKVTQELLDQKNAVINSVTDSAKAAAASAAPSAAASVKASAGSSAEELYQQYLGQ